MSNSNRITPQIERILIVVGDQNAGKSTTLRSMFVDPRLGSKGVVPATAPRRIRPCRAVARTVFVFPPHLAARDRAERHAVPVAARPCPTSCCEDRISAV